MSTALLKTPLRQVSSVQHLLMNEQARDQLAMVAANHMSPERMMRVVANAIRTTPKLGQCEPISFLGALMQCAALGLEPNTVLGHAYLIPFENKRKGIVEVQVVVGYKGLIDLARRSGHITAISANIHYSDDELWEYEEGTEAQLRHRPGAQDGTKQHAYAIAKFKDGGHAYVVLPWKHVMKIRDGSQGWQSAVRFGKTKESPWHTHEDAMAMKTAIRALAKYLPLSVEFADAMSVDEKQADYRAFAMDPTGGVTIEADAVSQETESETVDAKAETERPLPTGRDSERPQPPKASDERPAAARAKAPQESEAKKADPDATVEISDYSNHSIVKSFAADVASMGGIEQAMSLWEVDLSRMSAENPDLHAAVISAGKAAEAELVSAPTERKPQKAPLERAADMILRDLASGAAADDINEVYADTLARLEYELPDLYATVLAAIRKAG